MIGGIIIIMDDMKVKVIIEWELCERVHMFAVVDDRLLDLSEWYYGP